MPRPKPGRKARLRAAVALAGIRMSDFAKQAAVSQFHLNEVLLGRRVGSRELLEKVESFIGKHLPNVAA